MEDPPNSKDVQKIMRRVFSNTKQERRKLNNEDSDIYFTKSSKEHYYLDAREDKGADTSSHTTLYTRDKKGVFHPYRNRSPLRAHKNRSPQHQRRSRSPRNYRFERKNDLWDRRNKDQKKNPMGQMVIIKNAIFVIQYGISLMNALTSINIAGNIEKKITRSVPIILN